MPIPNIHASIPFELILHSSERFPHSLSNREAQGVYLELLPFLKNKMRTSNEKLLILNIMLGSWRTGYMAFPYIVGTYE